VIGFRGPANRNHVPASSETDGRISAWATLLASDRIILVELAKWEDHLRGAQVLDDLREFEVFVRMRAGYHYVSYASKAIRRLQANIVALNPQMVRKIRMVPILELATFEGTAAREPINQI
jgi:hypothetical protein